MQRIQELTHRIYESSGTTFPNDKQIAKAIGKTKEWVCENVTRKILPLTVGGNCYPIRAVANRLANIEEKSLLQISSFYKDCAFPKPATKKKKKLTNGWKDKPNRVCAICGARCAERHELFGGSNRQFSIENGYQIDLCREHHEAFHQRDGEWAKTADSLRAIAQEDYESKLIEAGADKESARDIWLFQVGKNYIRD